MVTALDLEFLGRKGVIAAGLLEGPTGVVIVDPGPASTVDRLRHVLDEPGRRSGNVCAILVTHVHLDHSGAVGLLVRDHPDIPVFVHERGARHLIDPSKLLESARLVFGRVMGKLWGEVLPVPAERVRALRGGEVIDVAGLEVQVEYTPGHARHHVSYLESASRTAFVGDTCGVRVGAAPIVLPPTPPPDIDLEAWNDSLSRIRAWAPRALFVTHFGEFGDVNTHLDDLSRRLREAGEWARALVAEPGMDERQRQEAFVARMAESIRRDVRDDEWADRYEQAMPLGHCWQGLARYWRARSA